MMERSRDALTGGCGERVLPAHVYDALQLSALMYGGIGAGNFSASGQPDVPLCVMGHLGMRSPGASFRQMSELTALVGLYINANDNAVAAINRRKGIPTPVFPWSGPRVSFEEWCAELNVVRGADALPSQPPPKPQLQDSELVTSPLTPESGS